MPSLIVVNRSGEERMIEATAGLSIMEILRDNGFDELLALCGGCCSCATCHVYFDPKASGLTADMSDDENDLLDSSDHRDADSRLSCQIIMSAELDGMTIRIAPED